MMSAALRTRSFVLVFLALLSLTTLACAQSVYQAIIGNAEFVLLNQITHSGLLLIILCFNLLPAIVLALVWLGTRALGETAADRFLSSAFLLLLAPFLLELHKRYLSPVLHFHHRTTLVAITLAIAAWLVFRYREEFERSLLVLSPVVVILPGLFLLRTWHEVRPRVVAQAGTVASVAALDTSKPDPPIFILLLDEFTRPALLDNNGNIDASRFPHFAELARNSTWFTNATANAEYTIRSIPVIVTGNFPHGNHPSDRAYPDNLFRLLAPAYDVTIHEFVTRFCASPEYHCPDASRVRKRSHLLQAVAELYLLRIAPLSVALRFTGVAGLREQQERFREFLDEIGATQGSRPPLEFMHYNLPHGPYLLTPDGAIHERSPSFFDPALAGDATVIQRLRRDYEMQVQFVDRELGRFLDKLKQAGIYDRALIVVTSDHGVSWKSQAPGRPLSEANAEMIFPVPLFIKLPGQTQGYVSTEDAQLIDLVPTIAGVAGVKVPWHVAGRDLFEFDGQDRQKIMVDEKGKKFAYPSTFAETNPRPNEKPGFLSVKLRGTSTTRPSEYKAGASGGHHPGHL
jgi:hypothetical protein